MSQKTINKHKVEELKDKVRSGQSTTPSGKDINSVLYGPQNDNQRASGGEYDS